MGGSYVVYTLGLGINIGLENSFPKNKQDMITGAMLIINMW